VRAGKGRFRLPLLPLIGLLLVPLAVAGLLTWSLGKPADRLHQVKAAVVNNDEPVTINGQLTPLGRQLSAKLVGGEIKSNYSWEFATPQTAARQLHSALFATPQHPYSAALLSSIPSPTDTVRGPLPQIGGAPPDVAALPPGCPFQPRCGYAEDRCAASEPEPVTRGGAETACFVPRERWT